MISYFHWSNIYVIEWKMDEGMNVKDILNALLWLSYMQNCTEAQLMMLGFLWTKLRFGGLSMGFLVSSFHSCFHTSINSVIDWYKIVIIILVK
jgi:hypothetical protein